MTDDFYSVEELRLLVGDDEVFDYYDLKNLYSGNEAGNSSKICYDCPAILTIFEKYRCLGCASKFSRVQSKKYTNKYLRRPYARITPEDKQLLIKFK